MLGVGPYDPVGIATPQFHRVDGIVPRRAPGTAEGFDKMMRLPHDVLVRIGVSVWASGEGWMHYLFPGEWYDYIPEGYMVMAINDKNKAFVHGQTDNDIRYGMLPYGWIRGVKEV